jgi:hypothetical protein
MRKNVGHYFLSNLRIITGATKSISIGGSVAMEPVTVLTSGSNYGVVLIFS